MKFTPPPRLHQHALGQLCIELQQRHESTKSWRDAAEPYGIFPSMARMLANGYEPGYKIRKKLNLPAVVPVEVCPTCGEAPLAKHHRCNGRPPRPRRPRLAIRLDDPASAARSIRRHMTGDNIKALLAELED
jgi:hypothetical protein